MAIESTERLEYFNSALDLLDLGKANTNPESQQILYELEASIWSELDNSDKIDGVIGELINRFNSPRGHIIRARLLLHQAEAEDISEKLRGEKLRKAYDRIMRCLGKFPRDLEAIRLRIKLFTLVFPEDVAGYYTALKEWKNVDTQVNFEYLYLGVKAFLLGHYDDSAAHFSDLEKVSIGHHLRTRPRDIIKSSDGEERDFEGRIIRIGPDQGRGYIECTSLENLRYLLSFSTQAQRFSPTLDQYVKFHIGFNYRGPSALALRLV